MLLPPSPTSIVAYFRVSTTKQGADGYGIDAQRASVNAYAKHNGLTILREFVEVESGRKSDRPALREALGFARRSGATLVVAKLDRLTRNVEFLQTLKRANVNFIALDVPSATPFILDVMVALAEEEARLISTRTKDGLAQAKARGIVLGRNHAFTTEQTQLGRAKAAATHRAKALEDYADLVPMIVAWQRSGDSLNAIAKRLNEAGHRTRNGGSFTATTVRRIVLRAA
ncbi:MAG: recombinase family protein [Vulcanimicrobiaceae bacterium]